MIILRIYDTYCVLLILPMSSIPATKNSAINDTTLNIYGFWNC